LLQMLFCGVFVLLQRRRVRRLRGGGHPIKHPIKPDNT
jgi:hypothetical protein